MSRPTYKLTPLHLGRCLLGENHVLGDGYGDDKRIEFILYGFLIDGGKGKRVLVDLGPVGLKYINDMFHHHRFFRDLPGNPDDVVQPHGNVFDWLPRFGLAPADIDHIIFTHLHADHHGMTDGKDGGAARRFPNARIHVSATGWQENLDKRVNGKWNSYVDYALSDFLLEEGRKGRVVFHDNTEVLPGLDVFYLGGHAACSQAVRVRTAHGTAIIASDEIYQYNLLEKGVLARLNTTPQRLETATNKLVKLGLEGAVIVPCHDPLLTKLYATHKDDWLHVVAPTAEKACRGWQKTAKRLAGTKPV